jgi:F0F1-type ATP synthase assembly protein I
MKSSPQLSGAGRYLALGIQMVVVTAVITLIGYWLDRKTGREPVFLILFFFLGALGGLAVVWRVVAEESKSKPGPKH